jgi:hypothetical protein
MKQAVEIGSSTMICISSFIKIGSGTEKFIGGSGLHLQTDRKVIS